MSNQQYQLEQQIAEYLATLLPCGRPRRVSSMCGPESADKYRDISKGKPFTRAQLLEHAGGRATWAVTLDADGAALDGVIDVDEGGQAPLWAVLAAAAELGITAYAIAVDDTANGGHNGGHVWCIFDRPYPAAHVAALMRQIADRAQLADAEIWPGNNHIQRHNQVIRLPLAQHRRAQTRGELLLQSGEILNLDRDLAAGLAALLELPRNGAPPAIELAAPAPNVPKADRRISPGEQAAERSSLADVRARFNAEHTLEQLLLEYGAQPAPGGYSCPCGVQHTHQTTLGISRQGRLFSYSSRCRWYTTKGWDAFGLYVLVEHSNNVGAALKALNPIEPSKRPQLPPAPPAPIEYVLSPAEQARRAADAQRKRDARQASAATTLANVRQRAAQDADLGPADRAVLEALLTVANDWRDWCRPSKLRLAQLSGYSLGSVKRSLTILKARGYFSSEGKGGSSDRTAIRTFLRGSFAPQMIPMLDHESDSYHPLIASEGGAVPSSGAAHMFFLAPPAAPAEAPDRDLLSRVRRLARQAREPGWEFRDYDELEQAALEQEAARLEQLLSQAPADVDEAPIELGQLEPAAYFEPGGASYDPAAAAQLAGEYTGRVKDLADIQTRWRWSNDAIRVPDDRVRVAAQPEQQLLEPAPQLQACPPAPTDPRFKAFAWRWNAAQQEWRTASQRAYFKRQALALCDYAEPSEAKRRWLAFARPPAAPSKPLLAQVSIGRKGVLAAPPSQALASSGAGLQGVQVALF